MQEHTWLSFVMLGVVLAGFTALLAMLSDIGASDSNAEPLVRADDGSGTPGPRSSWSLRSLPRDTAASTDPAAELDLLRRSVAASQENGQSLPVHVIDGMPGVGKTTFAVYAGHVRSERFPDGQLFVNLNGHTPGRNPVQATEALASLVAATGVPTQQTPVGDDIGAVTEARAVTWRSRLADRKALHILDNAATARSACVRLTEQGQADGTARSACVRLTEQGQADGRRVEEIHEGRGRQWGVEGMAVGVVRQQGAREGESGHGCRRKGEGQPGAGHRTVP
ncbi:hypothetical protein ACFQ8O_25530 [Streptomyces coelicoflavus]|uniref:hypothetical protein n=1 Tax=Streptomyces coelicoflavus TaxID=285562 RepID=UPI0036A5BB24